MSRARRPLLSSVILLVAGSSALASVADDAQALVTARQLPLAVREVRAAQAKLGATAEIAAALSWLARGELQEKQLAQADTYATEARTMALRVLGIRNLDSDPWLPTALGAAIEVHSQVLASRGQKTAALAFLHQELNSW